LDAFNRFGPYLLLTKIDHTKYVIFRVT